MILDQDDMPVLSREILEMIMEGKFKFHLSQAIEYRRALEEAEFKLCFFKLEKRELRKKKANLRRKLRNLNHDTATIFHTSFLHFRESQWGGREKIYLYAVFKMLPTAVELHLYRERWLNNNRVMLDREIFEFFECNKDEFFKIGSISSDQIPELMTVPFLIRFPERIIFHEESNYVKKNGELLGKAD